MNYNLIFKSIISYFFIATTFPVSAIEVSGDNEFNLNFNPISYLQENVPDGIITKYTCPEGGGAFEFEDVETCRTACFIGSEPIFDVGNVKTSYISRSKDRIAVVVDLYSPEENGSGTDSLASLSSTVNCVFKGMNPENI